MGEGAAIGRRRQTAVLTKRDSRNLIGKDEKTWAG